MNIILLEGLWLVYPLFWAKQHMSPSQWQSTTSILRTCLKKKSKIKDTLSMANGSHLKKEWKLLKSKIKNQLSMLFMRLIVDLSLDTCLQRAIFIKFPILFLWVGQVSQTDNICPLLHTLELQSMRATRRLCRLWTKYLIMVHISTLSMRQRMITLVMSQLGLYLLEHLLMTETI